ncbi:hypothetical protein [Marinactinospora rubrisoli]|uniref:Uncharacterized protein n=1 Tax=Marinactinospora rubrisoli TaxID=2715399 RepID=A0ABW2KGJ6_9ACTN
MEMKPSRTVPVDGDAIRTAEAARHPETPERRALAEPVEPPPGEPGAPLSALVAAGRAAVADRLLEHSPLTDRVMRDDIIALDRAEVPEDMGSLSFTTMTMAATGLRAGPGSPARRG